MDKKPEILVVDDDGITRTLIEKILKRQNYDIISASSGEDALTLIKEHFSQIYVILLDVMMPGLNGFDVLGQIKKNPKTAKIKVIMLTAMSQVDDKVHAFSKGASDYLVKPFEREELIARVETQVMLKRTEDNLEEMVKERTEELKIKDAQLIQSAKLASLGEMAAGIAHEINQPLTVIKMTTTGLLRNMNKGRKITEEMLREELEMSDTQVERIRGIIDHLRTFSRRSSEVEKDPVDINVPLRNCFRIIGEQLRLRGVDIKLDLKELPLVLADSNKLEQVFLNIIGNARDAMDSFSSGDDCKKILNVHSFSENGNIVVEISDTGGGIPEEVRDRIFEPFFTTKEVGKGTGIGLSISYNILKDFNGEIGFLVKEGVGTTFIVKMPVGG